MSDINNDLFANPSGISSILFVDKRSPLYFSGIAPESPPDDDVALSIKEPKLENNDIGEEIENFEKSFSCRKSSADNNQKSDETIKNEEQNDNNKYLPIKDFEDYSLGESFLYSMFFVESIIEQNIHSFESELKACDLTKCEFPNVYQGHSIELMVEDLYNYNKKPSIIKNMIEEIAYLKKIIYCWRRIKKDGNCFYRSIIFEWLESLLFTKNIYVLRKIYTDINTKFDPNYKNTKKLPEKVKKQYTSGEKYVGLTILGLIIEILDKNYSNDNMKNESIQKAYEVLIKGFNFSQAFDHTMILYLRYQIYEFALENQDKMISKDIDIKVGNLLPEKYQTDDGKFYFQEYFENELLVFYTNAEKLAIYLVPYVIKRNLKIIFYTMGEDCDIKNQLFNCGINRYDDLFIIYKNNSYDICYTNTYLKKYKNFLDFYNFEYDSQKDYSIVTEEQIKEEEIKLVESSSYNEERTSCIFNRKKELLKEAKIKEMQDGSKELQNLLNKFKSQVSKTEEDNLNKKKKYCCICEKDIEEINNDNNNNNDNDNNNSNSNCNNNNISNKLSITLPCSCNIFCCSKECMDKFIKNMTLSFGKISPENLWCCDKCHQKINIKTLIEFAMTLYDKGFKDIKEELKKRIIFIINNYCMNCLIKFGEKYKKSINCKFNEPILSQFFDTNKLIHYFCSSCIKELNSECKICSSYHKKLS